jgi:ankyrin repeat protein
MWCVLDAEIVALLLGADSPLDARDPKGRTALNIAAHSGHEAVVQLLEGTKSPKAKSRDL